MVLSQLGLQGRFMLKGVAYKVEAYAKDLHGVDYRVCVSFDDGNLKLIQASTVIDGRVLIDDYDYSARIRG